MTDFTIMVPSKPVVVSEDATRGVYEIEGFYPGYGHTIGNSLRRIILSSMPGFAMTSLKVEGISHEFSTITGVKEDMIAIILNLKKVHYRITGDEPQTVSLHAKGAKVITAADLDCPGQVEVTNPEQIIATLTDKSATLDIDMVVEKGLGYLPKELVQKNRADIGTIAVDAAFTPVRRVSYEVENMRVGNRTDYNKLRINIETDGSATPRETLEKAIEIMVYQLKAIIGFKEPEAEATMLNASEEAAGEGGEQSAEEDTLKTRIEDLNLSMRTLKALSQGSIRTVGGLARKKEADLLEIPGLGEKGIEEIKRALSNFEITLK